MGGSELLLMSGPPLVLVILGLLVILEVLGLLQVLVILKFPDRWFEEGGVVLRMLLVSAVFSKYVAGWSFKPPERLRTFSIQFIA